MNSKTLSILAIVTVVLLVAAVVAYTTRSTPTTTPQRELLCADLEERINDVAAISIRGSDESFRIVRGEEGWALADKGGYPVDFTKVKTAIVGLSGLEIVEPKTRNPERYEALGVTDPGAPDSESTLVTLEDAGGETLASVILGNTSASGAQQRFVRRDGEEQSWLVRGALTIEDGPVDWIERNIVGIPRDRIQRVEITHPDGETLFVYRDTEEQRDFSLADLPADRELTFAGAAGTVSSGLAFLRIEDVARAEDRPLDPDDTTVAEFRTFDGLIVTARSDEADGEVWASFDVAVDEGLLAAAADDEGANETEGEGDDEEQPDVREEAERLAGSLRGWVFRLSESQAPNLRKRLADITKEKAPPPEPEPAAEDPGEDAGAAGDGAAGVSDPPPPGTEPPASDPGAGEPPPAGAGEAGGDDPPASDPGETQPPGTGSGAGEGDPPPTGSGETDPPS